MDRYAAPVYAGQGAAYLLVQSLDSPRIMVQAVDTINAS